MARAWESTPAVIKSETAGSAARVVFAAYDSLLRTHGLGELNLSKIVRISFALHFLGTFFGIGRFNARCCSQAVSQVVFVGFGQPEAIQAGFPLFSAKIIATRIV
jgi:hypothetical protein